MTRLGDWLTDKYREWEKAQGKPQSYYAFSRFIDVSHSHLTLWLSGNGSPEWDDIEKLVARFGPEVYKILEINIPTSPDESVTMAFKHLPMALRERLNNAILEAEQVIRERRLDPESTEAKQRVVRAFERWGFIIQNPPQSK